LSNNIIADDITNAYRYALEALKCKPPKMSRLGQTKEIINANFKILDPRQRYIRMKSRKHNMKYIVKEIMWYLSGSSNPAMVEDVAKIWSHIKSNGDVVNSNYGQKIFYIKENELNQFERVYQHLKENPDSRRAIMFFHMYPDDYVLMDKTKDYPCTIYGQFIKTAAGKLDFIVNMRSNDLIYGWCNDVPFFTLLQEMMATLLNIPLGSYHHNAGSLHIYEKHFKHFKNIDEPCNVDTLKYPFEKLTKGDVYALLNQHYNVCTPFMRSFTQWI